MHSDAALISIKIAGLAYITLKRKWWIHTQVWAHGIRSIKLPQLILTASSFSGYREFS